MSEAAKLGAPYPGAFNKFVRWSVGVVLTINFLIFWALPIFGQGQVRVIVLSRSPQSTLATN